MTRYCLRLWKSQTPSTAEYLPQERWLIKTGGGESYRNALPSFAASNKPTRWAEVGVRGSNPRSFVDRTIVQPFDVRWYIGSLSWFIYIFSSWHTKFHNLPLCIIYESIIYHCWYNLRFFFLSRIILHEIDALRSIQNTRNTHLPGSAFRNKILTQLIRMSKLISAPQCNSSSNNKAGPITPAIRYQWHDIVSLENFFLKILNSHLFRTVKVTITIDMVSTFHKKDDR